MKEKYKNIKVNEIGCFLTEFTTEFVKLNLVAIMSKKL